MIIPIVRAAAFPVLVLSALFACGDDDAAQRKAFIAVLQTRIVDKPGIHVPHATADESKTWKSYASQYAITTGFNDALSEHVTAPTSRAVSRGAVTSLQDLITRRSDLTDMRRGMAVSVQGAEVVVSDPAVQRDLSARLAAMNAESQAAQAAQQRLQALVDG